MKKSKYIGTVLNGFLILDSFSKINENNIKRHYFNTKCLNCGKINQKDRFAVYKGEAVCECSYNNKHHGKRNTRLYNIWSGIKNRCYNKNIDRYRLYGQRGIKMYPEWSSDFMSFYNWAINNNYNDNLSLDRINVNGDYEPNNCRWVTQKEQCNNKRNNHYLTYNSKTQSMSKWSEETGINYSKLRARINMYHWSVEKALTTP